MDPLLVLGPGELRIHRRLFEEAPLTIIDVYLQCFNNQGEQVWGVPRHVLEALAKRFLALMTSETSSLDAAFGGSLARERNRLLELDKDHEVLWTYMGELEKLESEGPVLKRHGGAHAIAVERTAEWLGMGPDNVRRILTKSRQASRSSNRIT